MSRSRVSVVVALTLGLLVVTAGIFGAATGARAATDTITIFSAGSQPQSVGELSVVIDSTTPLTTVTVHLLDASNTDVMDPVMTAMESNTPIAGGYESTYTATIAQGTPPTGLPLGIYTVTVDATDAGTSVTGLVGGTLRFLDEPAITINASQSEVSYDSPTVTLTGQVTLLQPDGTTVPYANEPVTIISPWGNSEPPPTTDSNGDYTATLTPNGDGSAYVMLNQTSTIDTASSPTVNFTLHTDPVKLAAKLSAKTITYGAKETLSGTVTYEPASSYVPLANATVQVYSDIVGPPVATAVTNSSGQFSVVLPTENTSFAWTVDAGSSISTGDPYFGPAIVYVPETVLMPTVITGFKATLSQYGQVSVHGCLGLKKGVPGAAIVQVDGRITIQYAERPTGPWYKLGTVSQAGGYECGNVGITFKGTLQAAVNYAYYRAYYAGGAGFDSTNYLPAASASMLAWKYADRIVNMSVAPRVVSAGGDLTVSGRLQYYYSKWHDYARQLIYIILRPKGTSTWYYIVTVRTNSAGWFSATFQDPVSATWSALFEGNSTHLATSPPGVYVRVRGSVAGQADTLRTAFRHAIDTLPLTSSVWPTVSGL